MDTLDILVEIVGATDLNPTLATENLLLSSTGLPIKTKANAICVASFGGERVHKTGPVRSKNSPIWSVDTGCFFLLKVTKEDLVRHKKNLTIDVRNQDLYLRRSTRIGIATIEPLVLLQSCNEQRIQFPLKSHVQEQVYEKDDGSYNNMINNDMRSLLAAQKSKSKLTESQRSMKVKEMFDQCQADEDDLGTLALRFRVATDYDLEFIHKLKRVLAVGIDLNSQPFDRVGLTDEVIKKRAKLITERSEAMVGYNGVMDAVSNVFQYGISKSFNCKNKNGEKVFRVKPGPNPKQPQETAFMTEEEMKKEVHNQSTNWVEVGARGPDTLGMIFLEVLNCQGLPNLDAGGAIGNKTDSFVVAVYEDSMVQTDVIDDILSPMWMPWTQRSFVFHTKHPTSPLFLSAFDYDLGPSAHDGIGRVAINLNHFAPSVVHVLQYKLYPTSNVYDRESFGTVTIRLRREVWDERKYLLASLKPPLKMHINMQKSKSLPVANYTCFGKYDEDKYSVTLLRSYVNEIMEMKMNVSYSITDAFNSLIFWRGQVKLGRLYLPIHSMIAFVGGLYLVERPHLIPGCFFLGISWLMLANMSFRCQHPSPWQRTTPFLSYLSILMFGRTEPHYLSINAKEGYQEANIYEINWQNRIKNDQERAMKQWEIQQKLDKIGDEKIQTEEATGITLDPLEKVFDSLAPRLFPIQLRLKGICHLFRYIKAIITWEESQISFWVLLFSMMIGFTLLILPTAYILQHTCRLVIWVFLGPWMRIVDFIMHGHNPLDLNSDKVRAEHAESMSEELSTKFQKKTEVARIKGEDALKLKALRILRFGKYISSVPMINMPRHYDKPLEDSMAIHKKYIPSLAITKECFSERKFLPRQKLYGNMLPKSSDQLNVDQSDLEIERHLHLNEILEDLTGQKVKNSSFIVRKSKSSSNIFKTPRSEQLADASTHAESSTIDKTASDKSEVTETVAYSASTQSEHISQNYDLNSAHQDTEIVSIPVKHVLTPTSWNPFSGIQNNKENDNCLSLRKPDSSEKHFEVRNDDFMSATAISKDTRMDWKEFTDDSVTNHIIEISLSQRCESDEVNDDDLGSVVDDEEGVEVINVDEGQTPYHVTDSEGKASCILETNDPNGESNLSCVYQSSEKKFITFAHKS